MWEYVGMSRNKENLEKAKKEIRELREEFWKNVRIPGDKKDVNSELEKATRVADFLELGELMAEDAIEREESAGGHFREEYQTEEGEAVRDDEKFMNVTAWEYQEEQAPKKHVENLEYENIEVKTRSYK